MLRTIKLKNFVHFIDETIEIGTLSGPAFFMGENNSGKSCVFEAVRRCMSTSKNLGMSNPHVLDQVMIVSCHFTGSDTQHDVYSSIIRRAGNRKENGYNEYVIKIVYVVDNGDGHTQFAVDIMKENSQHRMICKPLSPEATSQLQSAYENNSMKLNQEFQNTLDKYNEEINAFADIKVIGEYTETPCEQYLKKYVDSTTVTTFPLRSISPYQWTNSNRFNLCKTTDNVKDVTQKAEILLWYLNSKDITEQEKAREREYFSILTDKCSYEFQFDEERDMISALNGNFIEGQRKPISILKIPEGIYEAKKVSIILSLDRFKTICLEDPDRGMHTQMVERFRDLVLYGIQDKVIILTSHQPSFISPWTIPRTFRFRRSKHNSNQAFDVVPVKNICTDDIPGGEKTLRIISSYNFPTIFLARRVIFVEGDDDVLFLTTLKQVLLKRDIVTDIAKQCDTTKDRIMETLYPLHIVPMIGEANKVRFHYVCKELGILNLLLLDNDALYNNVPQPKPKEQFTSRIYPFLKAFGLDTSEEYCKRVEEDVSTLERHGIFVWKKTERSQGNLDSVIEEFCQAEGLVDFMRQNNLNLPKEHDIATSEAGTSGGTKKTTKRGKKKMFSDSKLTSENITNVVTKLLEVSVKKRHNEIFRFVDFLYTACRREY